MSPDGFDDRHTIGTNGGIPILFGGFVPDLVDDIGDVTIALRHFRKKALGNFDIRGVIAFAVPIDDHVHTERDGGISDRRGVGLVFRRFCGVSCAPRRPRGHGRAHDLRVELILESLYSLCSVVFFGSGRPEQTATRGADDLFAFFADKVGLAGNGAQSSVSLNE